MTTRPRLSALLAIVAGVFIHIGNGYAQNKEEDINQMLEGSGFTKLLQHVPTFAQAILKQSSGALDPEVNSRLSAAFNQAFATQEVQRDVLALLNTHYRSGSSKAYLEFVQHPLVLKMAELEKSTSDPANYQAMTKFSQSLQEKPAPAPRMKLIQRLDDANRATAFSIDMQTAFFRAVFTAIDPVMEADMKLGEGELDKMVAEVRQSLEETTQTRTQTSYLFAFRNINDDELKKYVELNESEANRWATQLLANTIISAINQAAERAAHIMGNQ